MPKRLADVIEEYLKGMRSVGLRVVGNEQAHWEAEGLEAKLQSEFVILPKKLDGTNGKQ